MTTLQNVFLSGTARGKLRSFPTLTHTQTISSRLQLICVKAHFKINLASSPHSGRQVSLRFFFPFKKRTLKAAACEKQSGQPLLPSKIIGCSQDCRKKKNEDTSVVVLRARKPSCHHCGLISHPTHFFARASFFGFVSNYSTTQKNWLSWENNSRPPRESQHLVWEKVPQASPPWLRCSLPQSK